MEAFYKSSSNMPQSLKNSGSFKTKYAGEFDTFLKIRSQKQSIIESEHQTIVEKVQGFESLLKLTKTGASINLNPKKTAGDRTVNKSESSKTFNHFTCFHGEGDLQRFEETETNDAQFKKLNKMVVGLTEYQNDKESLHCEPRAAAKTSQLAKRRYKKQLKSRSSSSNKAAKFSCFTEEQRSRKFYPTSGGADFQRQIEKINRKFNTQTANKEINYPKVLLSNTLLQNQTNFSNLRKKIRLLENKARKQYGLKFQSNSNKDNVCVGENQNLFEEENDNDNDEDQELSELEIAPILAQQMPKPRKQYEDLLREQQIAGDCSIPKNLIGILENKENKIGLKKTQNWVSSQNIVTQNKRKSLVSPKLSPSYSYIRI